MKYILLFLVGLSFNTIGQVDDPYFYSFKDAEGWGVKRASGIELFPTRYDSVLISNYGTSKNRIRVRKEGKWGVVDSFGVELIPLKYASIRSSEFGYEISNQDFWNSSEIGFLNSEGDTIVPCKYAYVSDQAVGDQGDFLVLASKNISEEIYAIYSSDGIQTTDYEFDVIAIDSTNPHSFRINDVENYFGLLNRKTEKCGIYDGLNKRIVVPPIYDDVCVGWCAQPKNPHFHEGPIVYIGTTPVFRMPLGDIYHLITVDGERIFSSKELSGWEQGKRYYINEHGEAREVIGRCIADGSGNDDPPYVMKDDDGFFLVDGRGEQLLNKKRFVHIWKLNRSPKKKKEANLFKVQDENGLQSVLDHSLVERIPANYVSITYSDNNWICVRPDNSYDFYDTTLTKLDSDPRIFRHTHNFFFTEERGDGYLYGVKSKDSSVLISPKYKRLFTVMKYRTRSDTSFTILTDYASSVDIFNEKVERVMHFEADAYQFYDPYQAKGRSLLVLWKGDKLNVYDLELKDWIMKNIPSVPRDSIFSRQQDGRNANLGPKLEFFGVDVFFWSYHLDAGWKLYDMTGQELLYWNRSTEVPPTIVDFAKDRIVASQRVGEDSLTYFYTNFGHELIVEGRLHEYRFVSELDRAFIRVYGSDKYNVYNNKFELIGELNGIIRTLRNEPFYIHFNRDSNICEVVSEEGTYTISDALNVSPFGDGIFIIYVPGACFLASKHTQNKSKKYTRKPYEITRNIFSCHIRDYGTDALFDFYNHSGVLLFENFHVVSQPRLKSNGEYLIIRNKHQKLWVTGTGKIYHREML